MDEYSENTRLKAISKAYPLAWEEMLTDIGEPEDGTILSEWLHRQGCDWQVTMEKDGWTVNWSFKPNRFQNPLIGCWKSIESGDEAFLQVLEQGMRAVDLHLRPKEDFTDEMTVAHAAREKRKQFFKNKKK